MLDLRDRMARALGVDPGARAELVRSMIERHARDRASYWLQIALATAIATLGLVLGSTGVVIGAMLVSPLMNPIIELGMGLAVGSPVLVVRSFNRTLASVVGVVCGATAITLLLPYHEVTAEIAARTSPTVLDLFVAIGCAMAAAFTTVRTSDTMSVAAGTAIGIALVPPICVIGYGVGTRDWGVASGALLLFTANFAGIVLVAVVAFLLLGFDRVGAFTLETAVLDAGASSSWAGRRLHRLFGAKHGRILRVLMPLAVAAAIYVPLRRALAELAWEVRVRGRITDLVQHLPRATSTLRSSINVSHGGVSVRLAVVGTPDDAERLEKQLRDRIRDVAGVVPSVDVVAVATADQLRHVALASQIEAPMKPATPEDTTAHDARAETSRVLEALWPRDACGELLHWKLEVRSSGESVVRVVHVGAPLGSAATELLGRSLAARLDAQPGSPAVRIDDVAYPPTFEIGADGGTTSWDSAVATAAAAVRDDGLFACVVLASAERSADAGLSPLSVGAAADHVVVSRGPIESIRILTSPCPVTDAGAADVVTASAAGTRDASADAP